MKSFTALAGIVALLGLSNVAAAETTVKLTQMHICCGGCTKAIVAATKDLTGAKVAVDQDNEEVTITADDKAAAQKAVDAIITAGYHAATESKDVTIKATEAKSGNVKRLEVSGAHNCCGACCKAIKGAVASVKGATADTCKPKETSFVVEGDFDAQELVKALNDAGFHVSVK